MDIEFNPDNLFNELNFTWIQTSDGIYLLYQLPLRKFYILISKLIKYLQSIDESIDINFFIVKYVKQIKEVLEETLHIKLTSLNEDDILNLLFKLIYINLPEVKYDEKQKYKEKEFKVKSLKKSLITIKENLGKTIETYIKYSKESIEENFGNISDGPFLYCSLTNNHCNTSCKYFDIELSCEHKYYNFKYLSFRAVIDIINILSYHSLEEKSFWYKLVTGDDLLSKVSKLSIKRQVIREENDDTISEEDKTHIINNLSNIIKKVYSQKDMGLLEEVYRDLGHFYNKIRENPHPDDITMDELIKIGLEYQEYLCDIIKYIVYIRDKYNQYEFPYDSEYSTKNAKEEHEIYKILPEERKKTCKLCWTEERYNKFMEAFKENNILWMKITYNNYYWAWYKYILKREPKFEDIMIKYIIDKITEKYTYTFAHGIYIFDDINKLYEIKEILKNVKECININLSDYIYDEEVLLLDKEKLNEYIKDKSKGSDKPYEISKRALIDKKNNYKEFGILKSIDEKII